MTPRELIARLIAGGAIDAASVVRDGVSLIDASRRNTNFILRVGDEGSCFLKLGVGAEKSEFVRAEGAFYAALAGEGAGQLRDAVPALTFYDADIPLLALRFMPDAVNLREYLDRAGGLSEGLGRAVGQALATVHRFTAQVDALPETWSIFNKPPPFPLRLHRPGPEMLSEMSGANYELVALVQEQTAFCERAERLRQGWTPSALIHTDMRWENVLIANPDDADTVPRVLLIDWELASLGDPRWDVGSFLGDLLYVWIASMPAGADIDPGAQLDLAELPIERLVPCAQGFCYEYAGRMGIDRRQRLPWLEATLGFAALKLVQRAFENLQIQSAFTGDAVAMLQIALNVMSRPLEASAHLLEIGDWGRAGEPVCRAV